LAIIMPLLFKYEIVSFFVFFMTYWHFLREKGDFKKQS